MSERGLSVQVAKYICLTGLLIGVGYAFAYFISVIRWMYENHPYLLLVGIIVVWFLATFWYLINSVKLMGRS